MKKKTEVARARCGAATWLATMVPAGWNAPDPKPMQVMAARASQSEATAANPANNIIQPMPPMTSQRGPTLSASKPNSGWERALPML